MLAWSVAQARGGPRAERLPRCAARRFVARGRQPSSPVQTAPRVVMRVDGVSFTLERGETIGIVGESGCASPVLSRSIMVCFRATSAARQPSSFEGNELGPRARRLHAQVLGHPMGHGVPRIL